MHICQEETENFKICRCLKNRHIDDNGKIEDHLDKQRKSV